jgi:hypothetical protein
MRRPPASSTSEPRPGLVTKAPASVALLLCCALLLLAPAARADSLRIHFVPERHGPGITFEFGFTISRTTPPLNAVALHFPPGLSYATSALGMAECNKARLEAGGLGACPLNSQIGDGTATVRFPYGNKMLREKVNLTLLVGHTHGEAQEVLYYAVGVRPVITQLVFRAEIGTATSHNAMTTRIQPITTLPGAPNASVVSLDSRIGPPGLTYTRMSHHKEIHYHPNGMILPKNCPRRGYGFTADFGFEDNTSSTGESVVGCGPAGQ